MDFLLLLEKESKELILIKKTNKFIINPLFLPMKINQAGD
jgi:hypothetical protein